jgi:predicted nuclease with TOPRIM domain
MAFHPDPAWIALIGTVTGTVGLKVAEHYLGRGRVRIDDAAKIRDELREQIASNKTEMKDLEDEVDRWRKEYYDLRDKYIALQTELTLALQQIKDATAQEALEAAKKHALEALPIPKSSTHAPRETDQ